MTTQLQAGGQFVIAVTSGKAPEPTTVDGGIVWQVGRCLRTESGGKCKLGRDRVTGKQKYKINPAIKWYAVTPVAAADGLSGGEAYAAAQRLRKYCDQRKGQVAAAAERNENSTHSPITSEHIAPAIAILAAVPGYAEAEAADTSRVMAGMMSS